MRAQVKSVIITSLKCNNHLKTKPKKLFFFFLQKKKQQKPSEVILNIFGKHNKLAYLVAKQVKWLLPEEFWSPWLNPSYTGFLVFLQIESRMLCSAYQKGWEDDEKGKIWKHRAYISPIFSRSVVYSLPDMRSWLWKIPLTFLCLLVDMLLLYYSVCMQYFWVWTIISNAENS